MTNLTDAILIEAIFQSWKASMDCEGMAFGYRDRLLRDYFIKRSRRLFTA
jgi:hypothetical protein